ncbi:MAG: signal peptide peptidase SppA [Candidatus Dormibacteria bacterium]
MAFQSEIEKYIKSVFAKERVAVIPIWGAIGGQVRAVDTVRLLTRVREDATVRAVVLDIDSPGGGAIASEALYRAVKHLAHRKPVVAWIRGTGASGAYFLACGAWKIVAFPGALVGSIGVISVRPVLVDLLARLGTQLVVTTTGPYKDLGAPWKKPTAEDHEKEEHLVNALFQRFTSAVRESRNLTEEQLSTVTTGEVWLAEEAMGLGLLDELVDDEETAVAQARLLAKLDPSTPMIRMSARRNPMQRLLAPASTQRSNTVRWLQEVESWLGVTRLHM